MTVLTLVSILDIGLSYEDSLRLEYIINHHINRKMKSLLTINMFLILTWTLSDVTSLPTIRPKFLSHLRAEESVVNPSPTTPPGCVHENQIYPINTIISRTYDAENDWCYGLFCNNNRIVVSWDSSTCS